MDGMRWLLVKLFAGVCLGVLSALAEGAALTPMELTTQSAIRVELDAATNKLTLQTVNAPVEAVIREILAKTGWTPKLPPVIRGRTTRPLATGDPANVLRVLANLNELEVSFGPDGAAIEIFSSP